MAGVTLARDYDINRKLANLSVRVEYLERRLAAVDIDTGWVTITNIDAQFTAQGGNNTPQARRIRGVVATRGRLTTNVAIAGSGTAFTLPTGFGFEPLAIWEAGRSLFPGAGATTHRYFIAPDGTAQFQGVNVGAGVTAAISAIWMVGPQ